MDGAAAMSMSKTSQNQRFEQATRDVTESARRAGMTLGEWLDAVIRDDEPAANRSSHGQRQEPRRQNHDHESRDRAIRTERNNRDDRFRQSYDRKPASRDERETARLDRRTEQALQAVERWMKDSDVRRSRDDDRLAQVLDMVTRRLDHLDERVSETGMQELAAIRETMERLGQRVEDVADVALQAGTRRDDRFQADLERRVADIGKRIEDMSRTQSSAGLAGSSRLDRLEIMLGKVASSLDERQKAMAERPVLNGPRRRSEQLSDSTANGPGGTPLAAAMADIRAHKLRLERGGHSATARHEQTNERVSEVTSPSLDIIREEIARLAGQISHTTQQPALESLRAELNALRSAVAKVADEKPVAPAVTPDVLDAISARMRQEFAAINRSVTERLDASMQQDNVSPKLAQLVPALDSLSQRMETVGSRMATDLRRDFQSSIADLRQAVAQQRPAISVEPIEKAIRDLTERVSNLAVQPGADAAVLVRTNLELAEMRDMLAKLGNPLALDRIEKQVDSLSQRLDDLANSASRSDIEALSKELRHLARQFDPALSFSAMDEKLRALEDRIGKKLETGQREAADRVPLSGDILAPDVSSLERMIASLSQKIEAAQAPDAGVAQLDALQQQIGQIAARLERSDQGIASLASIERNVSDLFTQLDDMRHAQRETAEIAARRAAEVLTQELPVRHSGPGAAALLPDRIPQFDALTDNVSAMLQARESIDQKTQNTLEAVHLALEKIVSRLGNLEGEIARKPSAAAEGLPVRAAIEAANMAAHDMAREMAKPSQRSIESRIAGGSRTAGSTPPDATGAAKAAQAIAEQSQADFSVDPSVLAEPGRRRAQPIPPAPEQKPSRFSLKLPFLKAKEAKADGAKAKVATAPAPPDTRSESASQTDGADVPLEPGSGRPGSEKDAGARLVAAARRAAQTAVAETAAAKPAGRPVAPAKDDAKKVPDADSEASGSFLAKRKKPILLGLAAIVVAALSINVVSSMLNDTAPAAPQQAGKALSSAKVSSAGSKKVDAERLVSEPSAPAVQANGKTQASDPPSVGSLVEPGKPLDITAGESILNPAPMNPPAKEAAALPVQTTPPAAPAVVAALAPGELPSGITSPGLKAAVQKGDVSALYEVGNRLFEGRGVPRDPKLALSWFERAATAGLVPAQFRVGNMYEKGTGVARDLKLAKQWYGRAADKGNAKAIHNLGVIIAEGGDGKPDYTVAADLFRRAAQFGIRDSQYNIAILLARGLGVGQSMSEAYTWFALAAGQGDEEAGRKRDEVAARLSPDDLLAAKDVVAKFKPLALDALANEVAERAWDAPSGPASKPKTSSRVSGTARL